MKNILIIIPFIPYPLTSGGHQALFNGLKSLSSVFKVYVTYEAINNEEHRTALSSLNKIIPNISVIPFLHPENKMSIKEKMWKKISGLAKKTLSINGNFHEKKIYDWWLHSVSPLNEGWDNHLQMIFSKCQIDLVQVEMPWMIGAIASIPKDIKKVFVHHEIGFVRHKQEIESIKHTSSTRTYAEYTKVVEIALLNQYDAIITLSEEDNKILSAAGVTKPIFTSFATVDSSSTAPHIINHHILSFVGGEDHRPNYEGITWFIENCWNRLKRIDNGYQLNIIGKWSNKTKSCIMESNDGINFLGFVEDLGEAIEGTIMIIPITIGSGIRIKILDAASHYCPIISTSIGAGELPIYDGESGYIRDTPDGFIEAVLSLQQEELCNKIRYSAHDMIVKNYSFEALRDNRVSIINKVLRNPVI